MYLDVPKVGTKVNINWYITNYYIRYTNYYEVYLQITLVV